MRNLQTEGVVDPVVRENFQRLNEDRYREAIPKGAWVFFELTFTKALTNYKHPHGLGFMPKDIIQTSIKGPGAVTWNYNLFDSSNLNLTTTGACVVRAFVGAYDEGII